MLGVTASSVRQEKKGLGKKGRNGNYFKFVWYISCQLYL